MKKSKIIQLVLVATVFSSCDPMKNKTERAVYMRSDTTAGYSRAHPGVHGGGFYHAFIPYGLFRNNSYSRAGYYNSALPKSANIGTNGFKSTVVRGGFGSSAFHVSS